MRSHRREHRHTSHSQGRVAALALVIASAAYGCSGDAATNTPTATPTAAPTVVAAANTPEQAPTGSATGSTTPSAPGTDSAATRAAWLDLPNLATFAQGAVLVRSDPEGAWDTLDEFTNTTWTRSDGATSATALIELAARARVDGVRLTLDDYWAMRLPNEIVVEFSDAPDGPFREIVRHRLPETLPETGEAPYLADVTTNAEGRYVQVRLVGRRDPNDALGPFLTDLAIHGALLAPPTRESSLIGVWNGGWLMGTFEVFEESGHLSACLSRDGARAGVVVDGRAVQLRWAPEDGGDALAIVVRGADGRLHGTYQRWDAQRLGGEPASIAIDPIPDAEPICRRGEPVSEIERDLLHDRRARVYGILFDFAQHVPRPESASVLDELAAALGRHPEWQVAIEGHTDAVGDDANNQALSERRAAAVVEALISRGVDASRASSTGQGESNPVASNETSLGRAQNRRVEITLR